MSGAPGTVDPRIDELATAVYTFPTPEPEADGTARWDATTAVAVTLGAGGRTGLGWTYSSPAAAAVVQQTLRDVVLGHGAHDVAGGWSDMHRACRNLGTRGLVMQAISAVDMAWWDLKARVMGAPLGALLGSCRSEVPIYGSGGFTTLSDTQLAEQVDGWLAAGCRAMKIKIAQDWGTHCARDLARTERLRALAGDQVELMVDANGGYTIGQARRMGARLDDLGVRWFEEPVSSQDTGGLAELKAALRCDVAAGEYVSDVYEARALLPVVDCLQLDATRCGGYTGWLRGAALAQSVNLQVSAHCAPSLHAFVAAAVPNLRHVEWFADHARLEPLLVDGLPAVAAGALHPDAGSPGHGMRIRPDAERWRTG
ncbi:enolase C-terminal domain-like protein [Cumulibacter manganitolerans]|uniref:enolase C-terminal domain-like protein n=1 Tax=Cumulibacter manganitolerans TaxID=1884992 RepID=UPI001297B99C|nr:enolase C-terminal domain-like protein [Cumulibacter manganitolerans]